MSKSKHTPGPWTLHPRVTEIPPIIYADGITVAIVDTSAPEVGEREANARLIAAAPRLLEVAHKLTESVKVWRMLCGINMGDNLFVHADTQNAVTELGAAIEEAEGSDE